MIITYYHGDYYDKLINNTEINIIHLKIKKKGKKIIIIVLYNEGT